MLQVIEISLVCIGLSLEGDVAIGVASHDESHEPFNHVDEIEKDDSQFQHLPCVDALVVDEFVGQVHAWMHKEDAHQVDGREMSKRDMSCPDDFHLFNRLMMRCAASMVQFSSPSMLSMCV